MISRYGAYLPLPLVAMVIALVYGWTLHRALPSAIITICLTAIGGWIYGAIGQIVGVVVSALIIFFAFTLPEQRRQAHEDARREREAEQLPNEEDL